MSQLASLLDVQSQVVVLRWTDRVREALPAGGNSQAELQDHIPLFLKELTEALRHGFSPQRSPAGKEHGRQRYRLGFDVEAVVREYGMLRNVLFDVIEESGIALTLPETRILTDAITSAIAAAITEHNRERTKTEHLQAAQALQIIHEREARLATTLHSIGDAVISCDAERHITFMNPVAQALTGWTLDEAVGQPMASVFRIINEHSRDAVPSPVDQVLREGVGAGLATDTLLLRKDGAETPIDDSAAPIRAAGGALEGVVLVFRDVTQQKHAEREREALLERERAALAEVRAEREKLHTFFEHAPAAICVLDGPEHRVSLANPHCQALVAGRAVVGKAVAEALPELVPQGFVGQLDEAYRTGVPYVGKEVWAQLQRVPGGPLEDVAIDFVFHPIPGPDGKPERLLAHVVEVTERARSRQRVERLAEALRLSDERYRRVVEASGAGLWDMDVPSGHIAADARLMSLMGLTPGEPLTLDAALAAVDAQDRDRVGDAVAAALRGENGGRYLTEFRTSGTGRAKLRWVESRGQVLFDAEGQAARLAGVMLDVTARREAEAVRQEAAARVTEVLESMGDAFFALDAQWRFTVVNRHYEQVTHTDRARSLGQVFWEVHPGTDAPDSLYFQQYQRCMKERVAVQFVEYYPPLDLWTEVRAFPTDDGGIAVFFRDVSAEKQTELALKKQALFEQQLIGIVSHDLRNPLNVVALASKVLSMQDDLSGPASKAVLRIQTAADRATRLVRDLLDFTQARLGNIRIQVAPADLHLLTRSVVDEVQVAAGDRVLTVTHEGDGCGVWDADRLGQVVQNLVTNALKYSPEDSPVQVATAGQGDAVRLSIHNGGAPISPVLLARLFEPLQRGEHTADRDSRSIGLGLFIVKRLVDAHGGTIDVESSEATGTTFTVRLPRRAPRA